MASYTMPKEPKKGYRKTMEREFGEEVNTSHLQEGVGVRCRGEVAPQEVHTDRHSHYRAGHRRSWVGASNGKYGARTRGGKRVPEFSGGRGELLGRKECRRITIPQRRWG